MSKNNSDTIPSMREVMVIIGQQIRKLSMTGKTPSSEIVSAANAQSNSVGKYFKGIQITMDYAKRYGVRPDLGYLKLGGGPEKQAKIEV